MTKAGQPDVACIALEPYPKEYDPILAQKICNHWLRLTGLKWRGIIMIDWANSDEMSRLNLRHTGNDKPTDVLSFTYDPPIIQPDSGDTVYGEIVICPTIAENFAREHNESLELELTTLLTHGLLHLAGYDHGDTDERRRFEDLTHGIMGQEGIKPVSLWLA
ncbi:rRNA maturation RNase YbeY [Candidatus Saccharibacteria bacterium]|nr:rRNA maturation RNase YbeY [Candidatus Saccharibacteria bacterium]